MTESSISRCPTEIPEDQGLGEAYELELHSKDGKPIRFGKLVTGKGEHVTSIVVFIRHFFCAYDQDYVRTVSHQLTNSVLSTLPNPSGPSQLIIIGCGDPSLIVPYVAETSAAFPIYTDPTGRIYEKLHMKRTTTGISTPPPYAQISFLRALGKTFKQMFFSGLRAFKGGTWEQNGGEWIFRGGRCVYVHRMENVSDHLTAERLLEVLEEDQPASDRTTS